MGEEGKRGGVISHKGDFSHLVIIRKLKVNYQFLASFSRMWMLSASFGIKIVFYAKIREGSRNRELTRG